MKLICNRYGLEIEFRENEIQVLQIESSSLFLEITEMLWKQCETGEGEFVLSEAYKEKRLDKEAEVIVNPFRLDLNNRKILTKLYQELKESALGARLEETLKLENHLEQYIIGLCDDVDYPLTYKSEMDIIALLKMFEVKLDETDTDVIERLVQYVKLMHAVLKIQLFVFINFKDFFSEDVLEELYKTLLYEKIGLLLVERHESHSINKERLTIIDKDACVIYDR